MSILVASEMSPLEAIVLGIVQGITEFLPVSSTGHLTVTTALFNHPIDDAGVTAFTAIIQVGTLFAVVGFFWRDLWRLFTAWLRGLFRPDSRGEDYRMAWLVILGSIPIGLVGFFLRGVISGVLRNLWVVVGALVLWSGAMWLAERYGTRDRFERDLTVKDALIVGAVQCLALIPGVSRSGATISAGLFRGLDRVVATRLSFLMSIPSLLAAGAFQALTEYQAIGDSVGWAATGLATLISGLVGVAAIAWLLRLVARRPISVFIWYRLAFAALISGLIVTGVVVA
ncbi:MAG: undecaprenyl-diphosphate phosphatase [Promicromonosporaceae bacterium]|nr:undecaprenyl-diphosphate phosphatase [Promicromonosporaceae bacterium]